jgi:hypothetical protein
MAKAVLLIGALGLLFLAACAPGPQEHRCLKRIEGPFGGYQARWVRCPPGSPVVLPDDY